MQTTSIQWENRNELRKHPFDPAATLVADDGTEMPAGIVSDIHLSCGGSGVPHVSCVHVGPLISASVAFDGVASLYATVPADEFVPYRPYPLVPFNGVSGVAGFISFGDVPSLSKYRTNPVVWRFSDSSQSGILPILVVRAPGGQLLSFVDDRTGVSVSGDVVFSIPDGITFETEKGETEAGVPADVASFEISDELNERLKTDCDADGLASVKKIQPIRSFNFVRPNADGDIAIILN